MSVGPFRDGPENAAAKKRLKKAGWGACGLLFLSLGFPGSAAADNGDLQLELALGYRSADRFDLLAGGTLGLSDFVLVRGHVGGRAADGEIDVRLETTAGYVFDVLTWVPEISGGFAAQRDLRDIRISGLVYLAVRRYLSLERYWAVAVGAEFESNRVGALVRVLFAF